MKNLVSHNLNEFARQYQDKPVSYPDLSRVKGSVTSSLEELIPVIDQYGSLEELKSVVIDILKNSSIGKGKLIKYLGDIDRIWDIRRLQDFVKNIYLKGSNLGL